MSVEIRALRQIIMSPDLWLLRTRESYTTYHIAFVAIASCRFDTLENTTAEEMVAGGRFERPISGSLKPSSVRIEGHMSPAG